MLTVVEYSFMTPRRLGKSGFKKCCQVAGLRENNSGYGLLHCVDDAGKHVTAVTVDVSYLESIVAMPDWLRKAKLGGNLAGVDQTKFKLTRDGWPDEWIQRPVASRQ